MREEKDDLEALIKGLRTALKAIEAHAGITNKLQPLRRIPYETNPRHEKILSKQLEELKAKSETNVDLDDGSSVTLVGRAGERRVKGRGGIVRNGNLGRDEDDKEVDVGAHDGRGASRGRVDERPRSLVGQPEDLAAALGVSDDLQDVVQDTSLTSDVTTMTGFGSRRGNRVSDNPLSVLVDMDIQTDSLLLSVNMAPITDRHDIWLNVSPCPEISSLAIESGVAGQHSPLRGWEPEEIRRGVDGALKANTRRLEANKVDLNYPFPARSASAPGHHDIELSVHLERVVGELQPWPSPRGGVLQRVQTYPNTTCSQDAGKIRLERIEPSIKHHNEESHLDQDLLDSSVRQKALTKTKRNERSWKNFDWVDACIVLILQG
ncbi:hypothetical protein C8J56DRAFT_1027962 [Mycena floridula]|nr:hypothetical protein C8J56DRAFT_1027962 [Mycena floridula]